MSQYSASRMRDLVEVPWYIGLNPWLLIRGLRVQTPTWNDCALLSFSKTIHPHRCSRPRSINGYLVGCERLCECICQRHLFDRQPGKECSPGSGNGAYNVCNCLNLNPVTRDHHCKLHHNSVPKLPVWSTPIYHAKLHCTTSTHISIHQSITICHIASHHLTSTHIEK